MVDHWEVLHCIVHSIQNNTEVIEAMEAEMALVVVMASVGAMEVVTASVAVMEAETASVTEAETASVTEAETEHLEGRRLPFFLPSQVPTNFQHLPIWL